jgi:hypothetical protein
MRKVFSTALLVLGLVGWALADLSPGERLPNPTLTSQTGEKSQLLGMLDTLTVIHLWKCD